MIPALVAALAAASLATTALDLDACLRLAQERSPRLRAAAEVEEQAAAAAREARARRWPVVGLGASYRYTSDVMEQDLALGPFSRTLTFGDGHAADVNLGVNAPLFTGGELGRQVAAAESGVEAAAGEAAAARLDLARDVRVAFFAALGREAQHEAAGVAVERLRRHAAEVAGAVAAGAASEESRLRALAGLRQAEQRDLAARAARDSARVALGRLVGRPEEAVQPTGDLARSLLAGRDTSAAGVDGRADLAALAALERRQASLADALRGRRWPRVGADLRAHYGRPGVDLIANDWTPYATAAVTLDWALWDDGARVHAASQAAARAREVAARRDDLAAVVQAAHVAARLAVDAAAAAEAPAVERVELTRRILALVEGRLAAAAAAESEVLDAQDDLAAAETELVLARTRLRLAEATLLWTVGQ